MRLFLLVLLSVMVAGCASLGKKEPVYELALDFSEPKRMRFSGKGAGAGMMLSSSMGPMGIAIGVAIDEGIAKDIDTAFHQAGYSLDGLFQSSYKSAMMLDKGASRVGPVRIHIRSIGFKTTSGEGDPVAPYLEGSITSAGEKHLLPGLQCESVVKESVQLDQIKKEGAPSYESLHAYLTGLFQCAQASANP